MEIIYSKKFKKLYQKLPKNSQIAVRDTVEIFKKNPFDPKLKNHELIGNMEGMRSISAAFDLRIIYREEGDHAIVYLIKTGKHAQVYNG